MNSRQPRASHGAKSSVRWIMVEEAVRPSERRCTSAITLLIRGDHVGVIDLPGQAHRRRQVAAADADHVGSRPQRGDLADIGERLGILDRAPERDALVLALHMLGKIRAPRVVAAGARMAAGAAMAERRVVDGVDGGANLVGVLHARQVDAFGAHLQHLEQDRRVARVHAHERRRAAGIGGADHVRERLPVGRGVLQIEDHVVHAGMGEQLDHLGRGERDVAADLRPARLQARLKPVCRIALRLT